MDKYSDAQKILALLMLHPACDNEECKRMQSLDIPLINKILCHLNKYDDKFIGKLKCTNKELYKIITNSMPPRENPIKIIEKIKKSFGNNIIQNVRDLDPRVKTCLAKIMHLKILKLSTNDVYTCEGAKDTFPTSMFIDSLSWAMKRMEANPEKRTQFQIPNEKKSEVQKWEAYWVLTMTANIMFNPNHAEFGWNHIWKYIRKQKNEIRSKFNRGNYDQHIFSSGIIINRCQLNTAATISELIDWLLLLPLEYKAGIPMY